MEGIQRARWAISAALGLWLLGYLAVLMPGFVMPYTNIVWNDEVFTEWWYGCDALAKWAILNTVVSFSFEKDLFLYFVGMTGQGWALGNVLDELLLDPTGFKWSEAIMAIIFILWAIYQYRKTDKTLWSLH